MSSGVSDTPMVYESMGEVLPQELLIEVFLNNRTDSQIVQRQCRGSTVFVAQIPLAQVAAQVCRSWRAAALTCPFLWTQNIDFSQPYCGGFGDWLRLVLDRCKSVPIKIILQFPTQIRDKDFDFEDDDENGEDVAENVVSSGPRDGLAIPPGWDILFNHLDRISDLNINLKIKDENIVKVLTYLETRLRQPVPNLRSLSMSYNRQIGERHDNFICYSFPTLFLNDSDALKVADLHNIKLTPSVARRSLRGLATLKASFSNREYFPPTSTADWLGILEAIPNLETLYLLDWQGNDERVVPERPLVNLPHLKCLRLDRSLESCSDLFDHLRFPEQLHVMDVRCRKVKRGGEYDKVLAHLSRILSQQEDPEHEIVEFLIEARGVRFTCAERSGREVTLSFWTGSLDGWHVEALKRPLASLLEAFNDAAQVEMQVQTSDLTSPFYPHPLTLRSLLKPFRRADILVTNDLWVFIPAFEKDRWDDASRDVLLPSLKTILRDDERNPPHMPESIFGRIIDFVHVRKQFGHGIDSIEVECQPEDDRESFDAFCMALQRYGTEPSFSAM